MRIRESPALEYRGIMIDTARHFLSVGSIRRTIDMMVLSKLNYLHWHIADDESFPLELQSLPLFAQAGSYSAGEKYSRQDVMDLVKYARDRGIQIVPEVDSPAHTRSWGLSSAYQQMVIQNCPGGEHYNGQLDLSNASTYAAAASIVN
jgi:hexosaminidase